MRRPGGYCSVRQTNRRSAAGTKDRMAKQRDRVDRPKITILPGRGVSETINYLLKDRDQLDWLVAVGRNKEGEIFFYDTGGEIVEDLGTLEYLKNRIIRAHFDEDGD